MGFPTKNDHFGVFWGYHHFRKPPYTSSHYIHSELVDSVNYAFKLLFFLVRSWMSMNETAWMVSCWWFKHPANHLGCKKTLQIMWYLHIFYHINWLAGFVPSTVSHWYHFRQTKNNGKSEICEFYLVTLPNTDLLCPFWKWLRVILGWDVFFCRKTTRSPSTTQATSVGTATSLSQR